MKYRIRNTNTDKVIHRNSTILDRIVLMQNGELIDLDGGFKYKCLKPEFEVALGVYVGDYLLSFVNKCPVVFEIIDHVRVLDIDTNLMVTVLDIGSDYEVIKTR